MLDPAELVSWLSEEGITFAAGIPDSMLEGLCWELGKPGNSIRHMVAANEGTAVAAAIGWHVATKSIPVVYMQNSGIGNAINPLTSLAALEVFAVPLLIIVGWRGQPGLKDEPQHRLMGRITRDLLSSVGISWSVLPADPDAARRSFADTMAGIRQTRGIRAVLVERGTISPAGKDLRQVDRRLWSGGEALRDLCYLIPPGDMCVATVGLISRRLAEYRRSRGQSSANDLLVVGGMGHASHVALGIALARPERKVWCLDGDGALLMHLGSLAAVGASNAANFRHVVFNNGIHESVGRSPVCHPKIDRVGISRCCGYRSAACVHNASELTQFVSRLSLIPGPHFLDLEISQASSEDIPRPSIGPAENVTMFMEAISHDDVC